MKNEKNTPEFFYSVALAQSSPWSKRTLTYKSAEIIPVGEIVEAPLGKKTILGVVIEATTTPTDLSTVIKPIKRTHHSLGKNTLDFYLWMEDYYPSAGSGHLTKFLPSFIKKDVINNIDDEKKSPKKATLEVSVTLTEEQNSALEAISADPKKPIILHGITGSGKTVLFAKKIIKSLEDNKHVLLVVPEISLISQLSNSLKKLIPNAEIATYHSSQTPKKSREAWLRARSEEPTLFIGTRSSLFLPFSTLGGVMIDEAHEQSLKEDHESSHYHGIFSAGALAKIHKAQFIIGSATPPIPETKLMVMAGARIVCLHAIAKRELEYKKTFHVVDLNKQAQKQAVNRQISKEVEEAIATSLERGEQTLLFINKLGSAHIIECEQCGWRATCPRCDTNFVYHHDEHRYKCNICGLKKDASNVCDVCGGQLKTKSLAIKSLETEVSHLFPMAKITRFDSTNKKSESIGERYEEVRSGEYDIIIGTQLMAKGFDFPKLSTVGVINADALLSLPDINTEERLFAQLVQVAGRVGRGHGEGHVYIQTRQADNPIFDLVKNNNWHEVYDKEIVRRKRHQYPPSVYLSKITISGSSEIIAKNRAFQLRDQIDTEVYASEPFQAFYHKRNNAYYWQIICKSKKREELLKLSALRSKFIDIDFDPVTLL